MKQRDLRLTTSAQRSTRNTNVKISCSLSLLLQKYLKFCPVQRARILYEANSHYPRLRKRNREGEVESRGLFRTGKTFFRRLLRIPVSTFARSLHISLFTRIFTNMLEKNTRSLLLDRLLLRIYSLLDLRRRAPELCYD